MKRLVSLGVAAFLGFLVLPMSPSWLYADGNHVTIIKGLGCSMLDGNGNPAVYENGLRILVYTNSGNLIVKCFAKGVPNPTGKTVIWDYEDYGPCYSPPRLGFPDSTEDWRQTVSASGNAVLTCKFKGNK